MTTATLPPLKTGYTDRPTTLADLEEVVALMNTCAVATTGAADETVEQVRTYWEMPNANLEANQRVVLNPQGQIVGWVELEDGDVVVIHMDMFVHPDYENEGVGEYLYAWSVERSRERVANAPEGTRVVMRAYSRAADVDVWYSGLLREQGMQLIRHFWHMDMNLDVPPPTPQWSEGITLKEYELGTDKEPIFKVRRETFRDQFGDVERPYDEHFAEWSHYWESEGVLIPGLWLLAMDGDKIVGINLCKPEHNGDADRGWVSSLGVMRDYRRRGIGEALLYAAFGKMYEMGKKRVGLGVDASSITGAATLYKRVGMRVEKQFDMHELELRAGVDTTTTG
ncbi:MAG: GNAT family N-acetyltransferase [Chloroflexi bacterium]|nr:GNAT family N-acetyltransferase [Chloroflexota bacterium]MCC6892583.1 GNAT family N-acetyltransferase [Anaerolineae bacterium]